MYFSQIHLHSTKCCVMLFMLHKSNMRPPTEDVFLFQQKRILYFAILFLWSKICVATKGAMRFSVCSPFGATHFLFGDWLRMNRIITLIKFIAPVAYLIVAIIGFLSLIVYIYRKLKTIDISGYIQQQKKRAIVRKQNRLSKRGSWQFPSEQFFRKCSAFYISDFTSDYNIQKAMNIVLELAAQEGIQQKNLKKYLTTEAFQKYYAQGKEIALKKDNAEALRQKQPQQAIPSYRESIFLRRVAYLSELSGLDKRKQMLSDLLQDYQNTIEIKKKYDISTNVFEAAMFLQPQEQQSPSVPVRPNLINNTYYLLSSIPDLPCTVDELEECAIDVEKQLNASTSKVVLTNPTSDEILQNLEIRNTKIQKGDSGVLHITLTIALKKSLALDVPKNIPMVIDGVLQGTVMFENISVGDVQFPFPLYGIASNEANPIELSGLCIYSVASDQDITPWNKFMEADTPFGENAITEILGDILNEDTQSQPTVPKYTVKLANSQTLWIMEV